MRDSCGHDGVPGDQGESDRSGCSEELRVLRMTFRDGSLRQNPALSSAVTVIPYFRKGWSVLEMIEFPT